MEKEKKKNEKMERKEKKEKKEKKKKPAATITLIDIKRAGTSMGAQNAFFLSAMGHLWMPRTLCCVQTI